MFEAMKINNDNDKDDKNDNSINASGLKTTLFPDSEKAMSKAIKYACESTSCHSIFCWNCDECRRWSRSHHQDKL